jgi:hypothetical protein
MTLSRTTVQRWRDAGYVVMTGNRVDIARSEKLLAERPAVDRGGVAKGPTAETGCSDDWDWDLATVIADYEALRDRCQRAAAIYAAIIADLDELPTDADEFAVGRVHYRHQDALRAALAPWL